MLELVRRISRCEQGATAVEYGLIASLIVVTIMVAIGNTADSNANVWNYVSNQIVTSSENVRP